MYHYLIFLKNNDKHNPITIDTIKDVSEEINHYWRESQDLSITLDDTGSQVLIRMREVNLIKISVDQCLKLERIKR